jgi:hypothetical protein
MEPEGSLMITRSYQHANFFIAKLHLSRKDHNTKITHII